MAPRSFPSSPPFLFSLSNARPPGRLARRGGRGKGGAAAAAPRWAGCSKASAAGRRWPLLRLLPCRLDGLAGGRCRGRRARWGAQGCRCRQLGAAQGKKLAGCFLAVFRAAGSGWLLATLAGASLPPCPAPAAGDGVHWPERWCAAAGLPPPLAPSRCCTACMYLHTTCYAPGLGRSRVRGHQDMWPGRRDRRRRRAGWPAGGGPSRPPTKGGGFGGRWTLLRACRSAGMQRAIMAAAAEAKAPASM